MRRHKRKKIHELMKRFQHDYDVTNSSLKITIKTYKQLIIPVKNKRQQKILERKYLEYSKPQKSSKSSKSVTYSLKYSK